MLTVQCKKVLKGLRDITNNSSEPFSYSEATGNGTDFYCYATKKTYNYGKYEHEIDSIMDCLEKEGYLTSDFSGSIIHYSLTQFAVHEHQYRWGSIKHFLFTSIAIPIVVSVATALATTFLTLWLQGFLLP